MDVGKYMVIDIVRETEGREGHEISIGESLYKSTCDLKSHKSQSWGNKDSATTSRNIWDPNFNCHLKNNCVKTTYALSMHIGQP